MAESSRASSEGIEASRRWQRAIPLDRKASPSAQKPNPVDQKGRLQGQRAGFWRLKARRHLLESSSISADVPRQDSVSSHSSSLDISCLVDNTPFKINEVRCTACTCALSEVWDICGFAQL